ncbi:Centromere protein mis12 [Vanrija pseudolonga]|uniref:Centromere protein mis12 n=1 Tax=Vanrija pseudolonga TaxID=143232 RepID=A0AAF1BQ27_9TREE|nr:Centromere protein mis12 [Vanrija pseudolonga]
MPPRKSTGRRQSAAASASVLASVSFTAAAEAPPTKPPPQAPSPLASSSKHTLDDPPLVPESITWDYVPPVRVPQVYSDEDKERLVHELMQFSPVSLLYDIAEHAHQTAHNTVEGVEAWAVREARVRDAEAEASGVGDRGGSVDAHEREVEVGSHALETLLETHVDRAFDTFTAYALRNAFKVPDGVEVVMPWHKGIDFARAAHVAALPDGEGALVARLTDLRAQVEHARLVNHRLALAEAALDRRLEIAAHRRAQVGFIADSVRDAGLAPLPDKAEDVASALRALHDKLHPLDTPTPSTKPHAPELADGSTAWEAGRAAYLSWALGKALSSASDAPIGDKVDAAERAAHEVATKDEVDALAKIVQ